MRLYDSPVSANCYKVRLLAAQLGLELELVTVDIFAGEAQTPEHLRRNPAGRTPVLELDSGEHLPESGAIMLYLAEGTPLLPDDPVGRARATAWLFFEQNLLEPNIGTGRFWLLTGRAEGHPELLERWRSMGRGASPCSNGSSPRRTSCSARTTASPTSASTPTPTWRPSSGSTSAEFPAVEAWLRRVEATPGFVNDLQPYPGHAGAGGSSAHG